jgi:hypothetical protein
MQIRRNQVTSLMAISILLLGGAAILFTEPLGSVRALQEQQLRILKRLPFSPSEPILALSLKLLSLIFSMAITACFGTMPRALLNVWSGWRPANPLTLV